MGLTVLLCRHGESEANEDARATTEDVALTPLGHRQSGRLAARLASRRVTGVYASPLRRSLTTGEIVASRHDLSVETLPELREISVGEFCGEPASEWYTALRNADDLSTWSPSGGESFATVVDRIVPILSDVRHEHDEDETIVLVGHGGAFRILLLDVLELPLTTFHSIRQENCCINELEFNERYSAWILRTLNDTAHLEPD